MTADIFYPIFTLTITVLACFIRKKKMFLGFAPTPSTGHHPGHSGKFQLPPDPQPQSYLAPPKTDAPIFFLYYPLTFHKKIFSFTSMIALQK